MTEVAQQISEKKKNHPILKIVGRVFAFIGVTLLMAVIFLFFVMNVCVNGPSWRVKELFVLSVRESSAGGFLADIFLSKEEIAAIEEANKIEDVDDITDVSIVSVNYAKDSADAEPVLDENGEETVNYICESSYD